MSNTYLLTLVYLPISVNLNALGHAFRLFPALYKSRRWILGDLKPGRLVGLNTTRREACMVATIALLGRHSVSRVDKSAGRITIDSSRELSVYPYDRTRKQTGTAELRS